MTQSNFSNEIDRRSSGCWTPPSALPEATEVDRELVRATQAAIEAASHVGRSDELEEAGSNAEGVEVARRPSTDRKSTSLKFRFRSLFGFVLNGGGGGRSRLNVSNSTAAKEGQKKRSGCVNRRRAGNLESRRSVELENASNTQQEEQPPPPAEEAEKQPQEENKEDAAEQNIEEQEPPPSPKQSPNQQPEPVPLAQYPPLERPRIFRGGPTTESHKRVQDMLFSECRVIPIATLYKKVAMVPGHGRLFLSAANNPRPMGNKMLYDIAYENYRHHSDCNRDFARAGLKKICSNYCKPDQFRYVY